MASVDLNTFGVRFSTLVMGRAVLMGTPVEARVTLPKAQTYHGGHSITLCIIPKVYTWQSGSISGIIRLSGPEHLGGLGDLSKKAEDIATKTGKTIIEAANEVRIGIILSSAFIMSIDTVDNIAS